MNIYEELGVKKYINAHDTYTSYGGSRMAGNTLKAMIEISEHFVDIDELQEKIGDRLAEMTQNEGAYVTNGASGGLLLAAAVCMARGDMYRFTKLPDTTGLKDEIIVLCCQRNAYDMAISASGAKVIEVGDADETLDFHIEGAINERTAAIFYFESVNYRRASMPLEQVIEIAKKRNVPVIVDAAAQLPPIENLWKYTSMGASLAIFSGGKTLCGPQTSGLIVGCKVFIQDCRKFGAPVHGICRSSKVGREEMVGLYVALKNYFALDHNKNFLRLESIAQRLMDAMEETRAFKTEKLTIGPVGQHYPRALGKITGNFKAVELQKLMHSDDPGIYIGVSPNHDNAIYISPLNLNDEEIETVIHALRNAVNKLN